MTDEEKLRTCAIIFANDLAALLNRARDEGLNVALDSNEYDIHTVWYGENGKAHGQWDVARSDHGNGPYVAEELEIDDE